ncbi:MAG: chromosomal replication initiator protein DnaA [Thermodesulfobacteriota bacterium]
MDIWQGVLETIEKIVDPRTFENWFMPIKLISMNQETIEIEVPNKFFKDWFSENYLPLIKNAVFTFTNREYIFKFSCSKQKKGARPHNYNKSIATKISPLLRGSSIGDPLNQNYSFENFVVGNSNQFAHAASLAVATNPARAYNPLFIYGGVGLGKTHLLNAIGNFITNKSIQICYVSSENFMNELINSIRYDRMATFREKFRGIEVLLIDDIQFIAGKERTQEEFFHTFNSLYESQKQIVVTSDKFPKEIPYLEERLRSRFEWGLIADIQPPETETKIAILKNKAYYNNIPLPDDVAFFLAENIKSNIRELEGSLIRIGAFASLTESEINLNIAKEVLKEIISNKNKEVSIDAIQKAVAYFFKIRVSDLNSNKKLKIFTLPRQIAMYLSRKLTNLSFPEIGISFGGKDHSTVIYSVNKIGKQIESDSLIKEAVNSIKAKIE